MRYEDLAVGQLRVEQIAPVYRQDQRVPPNGLKGYPVGHEIILSNAVLGQALKWVNVGSITSCLFAPVGPVIGGYGIALAGTFKCVTGSATQTIAQGNLRASDISLAEYSESDDTDQILSQIAADGKITATLGADPLVAHSMAFAVLRSRCVPEVDIFAAGTHVCVGGAAAEAITVTGAQPGDIALVTYAATNDTDTIAKAVVTANTLTVTMSADPGTTHSLHYVILRPRGSFKPSHYIAYAGVHTTVGGGAAEAITVTGALATDIPVVKYNTTDDTDTILKAVMTANTLTVTMSADPGATHKLAYMILRAYPT